MIIQKSIHVARPPEIAFRIFCEEIGQWWPLQRGFSFGGEKAKDIFIEARVGGRFFERFSDGTEYEVGRVTAYQPPAVVAFTWVTPNWEGPTQVTVRFTADGAGTRVELEHSGWEQGENLRRAGRNYADGWPTVLGCYQERADAPA